MVVLLVLDVLVLVVVGARVRVRVVEWQVTLVVPRVLGMMNARVICLSFTLSLSLLISLSLSLLISLSRFRLVLISGGGGGGGGNLLSRRFASRERAAGDEAPPGLLPRGMRTGRREDAKTTKRLGGRRRSEERALDAGMEAGAWSGRLAEDKREGDARALTLRGVNLVSCSYLGYRV